MLRTVNPHEDHNTSVKCVSTITETRLLHLPLVRSVHGQYPGAPVYVHTGQQTRHQGGPANERDDDVGDETTLPIINTPRPAVLLHG